MNQRSLAIAAPNGPGMAARVRPWRYLTVFAAPVLTAAIIGALLYGFLVSAGETTGPIAAAHLQAQTGEKYGAALVYRPFVFKLERYRMTQPEVLLVGSSRVMAFAGEAFSAPVYNSGGAANNLDQAAAFIDAAMAIHKPKTILLGLDYWWFNPNREDVIDTTAQDSDDIDLSLSQLLKPVEWVADGQIAATDMLAAILPGTALPDGIGALAKFHRQGWDRFGRFDYGNLYVGEMAGEDKQFARTLKRLRNAKASSKFNVKLMPSAAALATLQDVVARVQQSGVEIVLLIPPVAEPVRALLADDTDDKLIPAWRAAIGAMPVPLYDFQDARQIGSTECEFIDGFHGGEVTYLRILDAIANDGDTTFAGAINRNVVAGMIAGNIGHARIQDLRPTEARPEVDFLALGCDK